MTPSATPRPATSHPVVGGRWTPDATVHALPAASTAELTQDYPMDIRADSIEVTDTGVVSQFSTSNASIPKDSETAKYTDAVSE